MLQGLRIALGWGSHVLLLGGEPRVLRESLVLLNHGRASCAQVGGYERSPVCSGTLYMACYKGGGHGMTRSIHRFMRGAWGKKVVWSEEGESGFFFFFFFSFGRFRGCLIIFDLCLFLLSCT